MPNSIDFDKGIFLHVIPVRTIVLCYELRVTSSDIRVTSSNHELRVQVVEIRD